MKVSDALNALRRIAPEALAEPWDKVGLHVGDETARLRRPRGGNKPRALLCIDLTEPVVAEAVEQNVSLIVAYHPPIFHPLSHLTARNWKQRVLLEAVRRGIAIYSPHTALDAVRGGVNDWLCDGLGEANERRSIGERATSRGLFKVIVFVPPADAERVRKAMSDAGGGWIGNYSECSYNATGFGTFKGEQGANPTIGEVGKLETVEELRLEMICYRRDVGAVVAAAREAHSYEEAAIDVFELAPEFEPADREQGAGRVHHLKKAVSAKTLIGRVKKRLGLKQVKAALPIGGTGARSRGDARSRRDAARSSEKEITTIAVCVGAGGSLFEKCPPCDAYVTGEMQHHQVLDLVQRGAAVILAGHTNTERPFLPAYREKIVGEMGNEVEWLISESDRSPTAWV